MCSVSLPTVMADYRKVVSYAKKEAQRLVSTHSMQAQNSMGDDRPTPLSN